ncbi:MAG TPA: sulfatase-like hydrolase/transferase [Bacteroidales bacterium]|nr:sulfatase-like hydrolase/transferase [Bacteroidales bacterium]
MIAKFKTCKPGIQGLGIGVMIGLITILLPGCSSEKQNQDFPNILFILADDLGYGDVACYNPESQIPTPNLDNLASEGMRFTDAHSASTVCTPTRYSILTGRMAFRTGMRGVFSGVQGPCLIEDGRLTLPGMLRDKGYSTACIGKWHIGMTFFDKEGDMIENRKLEGVQKADFSRRIPDGPVDRGFDYFYGTVACPTTDWIYAYIEDDRVTVPPTKLLDNSKLPDHPYSKDCRTGMVADNFDHETVDLVFLEKSKAFLENHVENNSDKPFFLYHSMQAVHLPSFPADEFKGKTNSGPHGDFIFEMDYIVGELMKKLDELDLAENTLVIFASDNGPEVVTVFNMRETHGHDGARPWRGMKRDNWEGGHRTPFIVKWPGKVEPNSTSNQLLSLTDIMATCADIVGAELPEDAAEDSYNMLPAFLNTMDDKQIRQYALQQTNELKLSIRDGHWKYLDHQGSGSNNKPRKLRLGMDPEELAGSDPDAPAQLYNLKTDPGEKQNLYRQHPEIVKDMKAKLEEFKETGRSAPLR